MARKRVNGEGNLRKRSNGTWEAIITLSVDPVTRKKKTKSLYAKSRKEAKAKMESFLESKAHSLLMLSVLHSELW